MDRGREGLMEFGHIFVTACGSSELSRWGTVQQAFECVDECLPIAVRIRVPLPANTEVCAFIRSSYGKQHLALWFGGHFVSTTRLSIRE
jgi:hypothetical protein